MLDVPGTRMHGMGEVSEARIERVRSVLFLRSPDRYGGYYGGMDMDFAEYAGSPEDTADYSERGNGNTLETVRARLLAKGFREVRRPGGGTVLLEDLPGARGA